MSALGSIKGYSGERLGPSIPSHPLGPILFHHSKKLSEGNHSKSPQTSVIPTYIRSTHVWYFGSFSVRPLSAIYVCVTTEVHDWSEMGPRGSGPLDGKCAGRLLRVLALRETNRHSQSQSRSTSNLAAPASMVTGRGDVYPVRRAHS